MEEKDNNGQRPRPRLHVNPIQKKMANRRFEERKSSFLFEPELSQMWMGYLPHHEIVQMIAEDLPILDMVIFDIDVDFREMDEEEKKEFYEDAEYDPNRLFYVFLTDGIIHREDGPAIYDDQVSVWVRNGVVERCDGGPAVVEANGALRWYQNGLLHRDDGPAWIMGDGTLMWYQNGEIHSDCGPASIDGNGIMTWYRHGQVHRDDGPAVMDTRNGSEQWYQNGLLHRDDGPAVIRAPHRVSFFRRVGERLEWHRNGLLHRDNGPAIVEEDGSYWWYQNGLLHRDDGPAFVDAGGYRAWYQHGVKTAEEQDM